MENNNNNYNINSNINNNINSSGNNRNRNNNTNNRYNNESQIQRDKNNFKKQIEQNTMFDFVLQWGSLAFSKILFFPVEFPIHALTTFIQSQPTTPTQSMMLSAAVSTMISPSTASSITDVLQQPQLLLPSINSISQSASSLVQHLPTPVSTSLIKLLRQKGIHIYDGGMVYIVHNMVTILINFIQRSFNNIQNNPPKLKSSNGNLRSNRSSQLSGNMVKCISGSLSLLKYALTLPLDVIMTRLIVHKFYRSDKNNLNDCTFGGVCKNEGIRALYTGWEVVVLKSLLEAIYTKLDSLLKCKKQQSPQQQQYQQHQQPQQTEKSPLQMALLGVKIVLDYILTVVKVRLNIRNIGLVKTLRDILSKRGIKGLFTGLNTYFMLFSLWMISVLVANLVFLGVKNALDKSEIPIPPPSPPKVNYHHRSTYDDYDDEEDTDLGLGVAMNNQFK